MLVNILDKRQIINKALDNYRTSFNYKTNIKICMNIYSTTNEEEYMISKKDLTAHMYK